MAIGLKRGGHEVTVATHENFELFVRKFDLKFAPIAGNMEEFLQSKQIPYHQPHGWNIRGTKDLLHGGGSVADGVGVVAG
ncbi:MAG: hypothetical protein ACYTXC_22530 [Nostoc sp.]